MKTIAGKSFFKNRSFKAGITSLGWAFVVLFLTTFLFLFPIGEALTVGKGIVGFMVFFLIAYYIVLAASCFVIVKKNPGSLWFVPLVCNAITIVGVTTDSSVWGNSRLIFVFGCALVLSIISSLIGALVGRRKIMPE